MKNYRLKFIVDYQRYENRGKVRKNCLLSNRNIQHSTKLPIVEQSSTDR